MGGDDERHARRDARFLHRAIPEDRQRHQRARIPDVGVDDQRDRAPEGGFSNHARKRQEALRHVRDGRYARAAGLDTFGDGSLVVLREPLVGRDGQEVVGDALARTGKRWPSKAALISGISLIGVG